MPKPIKKIDQWGPIDARTLYMTFWFPSLVRTGQTKWKARWPALCGVFERARCTYFWEVMDMQARGEWAIKHVMVPEKSREELWSEYRSFVGKADTWIEKVIGDPRMPKDFSSVRPYAREFFELFLAMWDFGFIPEVANFGAPTFLEKLLSKSIRSDFLHEALEALLASDKFSFHQESELAFMRAAAETSAERRTELFEKYSRDFYWVENSYYESKIITAAEAARRSEKISPAEAVEKIGVMEHYGSKIRRRKAQIQKRFGLSDALMKTADALAFSIWWQDHRKALAWRFHSVADVFSHAAEREFGTPFDDIMHYFATEWVSLFSTPPSFVSKGTVADRKDGVVFDINPSRKEYRAFYGDDAKDFVASYQGAEAVVTFSEKALQGTPVSRGRVIGTVKVLLSPRDLK